MQCVGVTDIGKVRQRNEDSIGVDAEIGLLVVADGMGGHNAGDLASRLAIETLFTTARSLPPLEPDRLQSAVKRANDIILEAAGAEPSRSGMGTTVVAAWLSATHLDVAHVGDSRLYRLRAGVLEMLTRLGDSQMKEIRAITDYQIALIDLSFATGTLLGYTNVSFSSADFTPAQ